MADKYTFKRMEKKYLMSAWQYEQFLEKTKTYLQLDRYGLHTICNIYYDTDDYELIRRSIEKPTYKEKLRLRSYGIPSKQDEVFLEIKKKWKGVVYKRRVSLPLEEAKQYLENGQELHNNGQIEKEIDYFVKFYQPKPKMYIAYDREAFYGKEDENVRVTIDRNIRSREDNLQLESGDFGDLLLEENLYVMEIKINAAIPMWLVGILSELEIYPMSFSKYGNIYKKKIADIEFAD